MRLAFIFVAAVAVAAACSSSGGGNKPPVDAFQSTCGQPGDMGNELGVGKFCQSLSDCSGSAGLCSSIGDPTTHFCTFVCQQTGSAGQCGTNATCECQGNQCGCTPNSCLGSGG
jgi:hypothetical protein